MAWKIEWDEQAFKDLQQLDRQAQRNILRYLSERIEGSDNPRRLGKPLKGDKAGIWRYRVGDYRLLCHLEDEVLVVLVVAVGHRREIYRKSKG